MQKHSVVIIAPGHDVCDKRVLRTVEVFRELSVDLVVFFERRFNPKTLSSDIDQSFRFVDSTKPFLRFIPRTDKYLREISGRHFDCVLVHDSGLNGLLICSRIRSKYPDAIIILDYHDFVDWEIVHQIQKFISRPFLVKSFSWLVNRALRILFTKVFKLSIDGIIGISEGQLAHLESFLGKRLLNRLVVPNTRVRVGDRNPPHITYNNPDFVWLGNMVDGRDWPEMISYLDKLRKRYTFRLFVFGKAFNIGDSFVPLKRSYIHYCGSFQSDDDILKFCEFRPVIGLFFGWPDPFRTGINHIASPNKLFSYLNCTIPIIYHHSLDVFPESAQKLVGESFFSFSEFESAYNRMSDNYAWYVERSKQSRDFVLWDESAKKLLHRFFRNVLHF